MPAAATATIDALKSELGIERLVLAIHDASFPGDPDEDVGRGSPYSSGARRFLAWARGLGFDGVQLGPQGETSESNPSPYDARLGGKSFLSVALGPLVREGLLRRETLATLCAERPAGAGRVHHRHAWAAMTRALDEATAGRGDREGFIQGLLDEQHRRLRAELDLRFYGDLQIGMAPEDARALSPLFLPDYDMGAPPSRTNPDGQPWGYPVYHPDRRAEVSAFIRERARRMAADFDGIRIDHPHGLVCPWVYRRGTLVADGTRLYESPDLPELARYAIARPDQITSSVPRHADGWVRELDDDQVGRFSILIDAIVAEARGEVVCEVLSTLPYPLSRVMARHGLGRFRVVQKLSLDDPRDVYRIENAEPPDWIMAGNHDTPPIWRLAPGWLGSSSGLGSGRGEAWAAYLSRLIGVAPAEIGRGPGELVHALFAAMLASRAKNVLVFFPDLLGLTDIYNVPGVTNEDNWTLRVPPDFEARHRELCATGRALDLTRALTMAARARGLLSSRS